MREESFVKTVVALSNVGEEVVCFKLACVKARVVGKSLAQ